MSRSPSVFVFLLLLVCQTARAAVVEVEVTIKSVDVKARGVTVIYETKLGQKTIDLDVSRKAEITINGNSGTLASLRPGQKAKVAFEKELQVVTKIDATGIGTAPGPEVVRFMLSISAFGDCVLKIGRTSTPISLATTFDGRSTRLAYLPHAEVLKAPDGQFRIIHSFDHSDDLSRLFSLVQWARLDESVGALMMTVRKRQVTDVLYWSLLQLPVVICYDLLPMENGSGVSLSFVMGRGIGSLWIDLGQENDKPFAWATWFDHEDPKARKTVSMLDRTPFDLADGYTRQFRLPLPNTRIDETCSVIFEAAGKDGMNASLLRLLIQGRLHPVAGIYFKERMNMVFVQAVRPNSCLAKAGLQTGDVVLSINGQEPKSERDAVRLSARASIGDETRFKVRRGEEVLEVKMVVE